MPRFLLSGILLCSALLLSGCDSSSEQTSGRASLSATELALPLPDRIRSITALDASNIVATAIINGVPVSLQPDSSGGYRGSIQVPARSTFDVEIEFSEQFADQQLVLASRSERVTTGSANQSLSLRRAGYDFSSHDADGDAVSNITEREEDTDPLDASDSPAMVSATMIASRPLALAGSDFSDYFFEGSVGRDSKELVRSGGVFRADFYIVDRAPVVASVAMIETVTGQQFEVATQSRQLNELNNPQIILFESAVYDSGDRDNDGRSDIAELVAGTDITSGDNPPLNNEVILTTSFDIPTSIENPQSVYAEYRIDGQLISLSRNENSYTSTTNISKNTTVLLNVAVLDNFNNQSYILANAQKVVAIGDASRSVNFSIGEFSLEQDTDGDEVLNYIERVLGTDPFNPPVVNPPVTCSISPLPITTGSPGVGISVNNISSFVNCGSADYVLTASSFNFVWDEQADNISWQISAESNEGDTISYTLQVTNPDIPTEVYATALVQTEVVAGVCNQSTELQIQASKDLFFQNGRIFNNEELRVNSSNRKILIGFDVPEQQGDLLSAQLVLAVEDDGGSGTIEVYQDDSYEWDEGDNDLELPNLTNLVGSRTGAWQTDTTYQIGLTSLFVDSNSDSLNLFLQQVAGGNDVDFTSRETSTPPVLVLNFTDCP